MEGIHIPYLIYGSAYLYLGEFFHIVIFGMFFGLPFFVWGGLPVHFRVRPTDTTSSVGTTERTDLQPDGGRSTSMIGRRDLRVAVAK